MGHLLPTDHCLRKTFATALLLTGTTCRAEAAMLKGIESLTSEPDLDNRLFVASITAALDVNRTAPNSHLYPDEAVFDLSKEIHAVLRLPQDLRECFVLRVLLGLTRERCANLLGLDQGQIGQYIEEAVLKLAQLEGSPIAGRSLF